MQQLDSTRFRVSYGRLDVPVEVTVNGHVIGTWVPGVYPGREPISVPEARRPISEIGVPAVSTPATRASHIARSHSDATVPAAQIAPIQALTQADRDSLLRKMNAKAPR